MGLEGLPELTDPLVMGAVALGSEGSLGELLPDIYQRLRTLAGAYLARERGALTLSPTVLVHEAYLRLREQPGVSWRGPAHVVALAAHMMRRILVNHAVAGRRLKRGQPWQRVTLDTGLEEAATPQEARVLDVLDVDEALERLAVMDPRQARVVELRCFGGMTVEEIAEVLGVSSATVKREWATARLWLLRELGDG